MSNCTIIVKHLCSRPLIGVQVAKPPARKNDVILRACPQAYTPEGSRDAPIYKRVAVP